MGIRYAHILSQVSVDQIPSPPYCVTQYRGTNTDMPLTVTTTHPFHVDTSRRPHGTTILRGQQLCQADVCEHAAYGRVHDEPPPAARGYAEGVRRTAKGRATCQGVRRELRPGRSQKCGQGVTDCVAALQGCGQARVTAKKEISGTIDCLPFWKANLGRALGMRGVSLFRYPVAGGLGLV